MNYYLETQNLMVGYDNNALIHDISIGIYQGEVITLIGPNGSGKSTILKSIARQLKTIDGNIFLNNQNLSKINAKTLSQTMAVMLTDRVKTELYTCREVVAMGRYPFTGRFGMLSKADHCKVDEAMAQVGALSMVNKDFNTLSDGQKQRILLARALCQEPAILILDEPTSFLDIHYKLELLSILRRLAREKGITVLLSLHEIDLAEKVSDRVLCVKGSTIAHFGTASSVFTDANINALYDLQHGYYDSLFGSVELERPEGKAEVFVLSNCGAGIPVYRSLSRQSTPFYAGILYENDIDFRLARLLASEVISEKPFEMLQDETIQRAKYAIDQCDYLLNANTTIGMHNQRMQEIIDHAKQQNKYREIDAKTFL